MGIRNLSKSFFLASLLVTLLAPTTLADDFDCGEWDDVPNDHMEIITEICEYGLMQGYSESDYGYGESIIRAELTHVANRIAMGVSNYDEELEDLSWSTAYNTLTGYYTDTPDPSQNSEYGWLVEAMYFGRENDIMEGDGNSYPTTYRPFDETNIVESLKVLYEAAYAGDVLAEGVGSSPLDYDGNPWWGELMSVLEYEGVIVNLETDPQSFWLAGPLTIPYRDFGSSIDREDAAIFLYYMIQEGLVDAEKLADRLGDTSKSDWDLAVTDIYLSSIWGSFYVEVTNYGEEVVEISDGLNLQLFINDDEPISAIKAADLAEEDADWLSPGGVSTFGPFVFNTDGAIPSSIRAHIDEDDVLEESDEDNNSETFVFEL